MIQVPYEAKLVLLDFLDYEVDGKNMADWIVIGVERRDLDFVKEKSGDIFVSKEFRNVDYNLYIDKDGVKKFDENFKFGVGQTYIGESVSDVVLENLYSGRIFVRLTVKTYVEAGEQQ